MILIGDKLIPFEEIFNISNIEEIKTTKANSTILFKYEQKLMKYSFENELNSAVVVNSIKESIYANALNAKYIITNKNLAKDIQKIADNYMFDSKVLALITTNNEIEEIALNEIDGAIYQNLL